MQPCGARAANALLGRRAIDDQALLQLHLNMGHPKEQYQKEGASAHVLCAALARHGLQYAGETPIAEKLLLHADNHWTALVQDEGSWRLHDGDQVTPVGNVKAQLVGHTVLAFGTEQRAEYKGPWLAGLGKSSNFSGLEMCTMAAPAEDAAGGERGPVVGIKMGSDSCTALKMDANSMELGASAEGVADMETVMHTLRHWCIEQPDKVLYTWLDDSGKVKTKLTYRELEMRADAVAHALLAQWHCQPGDRAVLMYLPGLDFICAFWGCLIAGVVAVPVYPVDLRKFKVSVERFGRIVEACQPKVALTHTEYRKMKNLMAVKNVFEDAKWPEGLAFEVTDALKPRQERSERLPEPGDLAFLQFTSGSTGDPKGVMLSHANLLNNCEQMKAAYHFRQESVAVSWLPIYHDMGLIGSMVGPAYRGGASVSFSPMAFIGKPGLWLQ